MANPVLSLSGIFIMLVGVSTSFSYLALMKIYDYWFGIGVLSMPIILGGGMFILGIVYDTKEVFDTNSRSPIK